ncbi:MAG: DUF222 domain-containing protein, partial [Geodermatophilaceae bacterium]
MSALLDDLTPLQLGHRVTTAVAEVGVVPAGVAEAPLWSLTDTELPELLAAAGTALARLQGLIVRLVGETDVRELASRLGCSSTAALARQRLAMTPAAAAELTTVARAARGDMARTGHALAAGRISYPQAAAIVRAVDALPEEAGPDVRRRAEAHLIGEADRFDAAELTRLGRHILEVVAPDTLERLEAEQLARAEQRATQRREFTMIDDGHGLHWLRGRLTTEAAAVLRAALDPLSAPMPAADGARDMRTPAQRRADALIELARRALTGDQLPDHGGQRPQVVVTVPLRTLTDQLGHATLDDGGILSATAARILACDCHLIPAVLGAAGQVLDLGRAQRLFTGSLRRALNLRDRGCAFPGCDRPAAWCHGHHIIAWADGGNTSLANAVLLCGHHHAVVHRDNWTIRLADDG